MAWVSRKVAGETIGPRIASNYMSRSRCAGAISAAFTVSVSAVIRSGSGGVRVSNVTGGARPRSNRTMDWEYRTSLTA